MNTFTGTSEAHSTQRRCALDAAYNSLPLLLPSFMATIEELADRVERLLLRHEELQRTNALITAQLAAVTGERDNLRSRLNAAKSRIDVLLQRLPRDPADRDGAGGATVDVAGAVSKGGATLRSIG
jgi:ABC-type phosphate transport system auxiliary subunit